MAKYIQIIGFLLIIIGAVLIALSMNMGWNNNNLISFGSVVLVIAGLITYVFAGKEVLREKAKEK